MMVRINESFSSLHVELNMINEVSGYGNPIWFISLQKQTPLQTYQINLMKIYGGLNLFACSLRCTKQYLHKYHHQRFLSTIQRVFCLFLSTFLGVGTRTPGLQRLGLKKKRHATSLIRVADKHNTR